jgi:large subunit ribosomal protein L9
MEVILLERIEKLGQMGDTVKVKAGFARNYLLPQKKALRATKDNQARFESQRVQLEATNLHRREEAQAVGTKLDGMSLAIIRQAGESGILYGSVSGRDVAESIREAGFAIERRQVVLDTPIKSLGTYAVRVSLHPEVAVIVRVTVARSQDEANRAVAANSAPAAEAVETETAEEVVVVEETAE